MADGIPPPPPGFTLDPQPVYGAPANPAAAYQGPQAAANLQRTQQEVEQAQATAAANTAKAKAEARSAEIAAKNATEQYQQQHVAENPALVGLTGPALLAKLPPDEAPLVKAMIEGRVAPPTASALKDPQWQQRLKWASQVDPDFNEARWAMRVKTMGDAATGRLAQANNAINTAIGHAGLLMDQAGQPGVAGHGDWPLIPDIIPTAINAVQNAANKGNPALSVYNDTAQKLGTEEARAYQGGAPNEGDTNRYVASLSANLPYDAKKAVIHNALELFASKTVANLSQYDFGTTGGKPPLNVLDGHALKALQTYAPDVLDKYFYHGFIGPNGAPTQNGGPPGAPPPGMGGQTPQNGGGQPPLPPDQLTPATGQTKDVIDTSLTPVRREYMARLAAGQSGTQLVGFLRAAGLTDPELLKSAAAQAAFHRQHPDVPIAQYNTAAIDHHVESMGAVNRVVNTIGQSAPGAAIVGAGEAIPFAPDVVAAASGNPMQARLAMQYSAQDHPGATLAGQVAGGALAALSGEAALAKGAGMAPGFARSLIADTGYGAAEGASNSPDNRLGGAAEGAALGAAGSVAGQAAAKGVSAALRGVSAPAVQALRDAGIPLTVGQAVGQSGRVGAAAKGVEDRLAGLPVVGDAINARRAEGVQQFNSGAFNKALEPINANVGNLTGENAVAAAQDKVSQAFSSALKGKVATPDAEFISAARGPMERLASIKRDGLGPEIVDQIEESTRDLFDPQTGALSGENMQTFLESLRQIRQSYRSDPLYARVIKPNVQGIENAVVGMFSRQAPEVMPAFNSAKAAYRRLSVLEDAVNKAKNTDGTFTPGQLGMADRANAIKYGSKGQAASGDSPFFDYQRAAQQVLPNKVPDSGTAGRLALLAAPGAIAGSGAGLGYATGDAKDGAGLGLGLAGILALAYTRTGQRRLADLLMSRDKVDRAIAEGIMKRLPYAGAGGSAAAASAQTSSSR